MITYNEALKRPKKNRNRKWVSGDLNSTKILSGLTLFAGRPGMGLTSSTISVLNQAIEKSKKDVLFISLSESDYQIAQKAHANGGDFYIEDQVYKASDILSLLRSQGDFVLVVIDNFQLIEFDIPYQLFVKKLDEIGNDKVFGVILIYELGRSVEKRGGDKVPRLEDLNEYPALKKLDYIFYLYRPSYYGITEDENGEDVSTKVVIGSF